MALAPLPPIPNTRLVDDPTRDAIWRRYLEQFFNRVMPLTNVHNDLSGLQGGTTAEYYHLTQAQHATVTSYLHNNLNGLQGGTAGEYYHLTAAQHSTVTSFGTFTNNRVLFTSPTSTITTSGDLTFNSATSTLTGVNVSTTGNTTLGDGSGDSLTINAGTWTIGNDFQETRAAGTVATGTFDIMNRTITYTGDAGGNSSPRGYVFVQRNNGANPVNNPITMRVYARNAGTGLISQAHSIMTDIWSSGTGGFTQADGFRANSPTISAGTIGTLRGMRVLNQGNASVTTALGVVVDDFTNSTTMRAYVGEMSSGTGKTNLYMSGTADNILRGNVRIGSSVAPTVALDVTGAALISTTLGVTSTATFSSISTTIFNATSTATLALADINGGNIDATAIGAATASTGSFTNISTISFFTSTSVFQNVSTATLFCTSTATLPLVNIDGGNIDSTAIGANTASTGVYTNVSTTSFFTSTGAFAGTLTGNGLINISSAAAGQIQFPATQNASANANTLDDYEEGTWTPTLQDASRSDGEGQTYGTQVGWYTKIGNMVHVGGQLATTSTGTLSTLTVIAGLPFTSKNVASQFGGLAAAGAAGLAITAGQAVVGQIAPNDTAAALRLWDLTTGDSVLTPAEWSNDGNMVFWGHYHTD